VRDPAVTPTFIFWARNKFPFSGFLALGKDADPDIPIKKEARAEYAKLLKTRPDFPAHLGTLVPRLTLLLQRVINARFTMVRLGRRISFLVRARTPTRPSSNTPF